jgi:hypothetical protein
MIFCIVLFIYLHVVYHLKVSDDLEVYELEDPSKDKLEEICDIRQPVIFDFKNDDLINQCNLNKVISDYGAFDIKIRNLKDKDYKSEMYVPLTLNSSHQLFSKDEECKYLSENNEDFLIETGLIKSFKYNDSFIRPYMVSNCEYDYIISSENSETKLKYELNYRNYLFVSQGSITIKLLPPKSNRYLNTEKDYENFEFSSPINIWNVQEEYKNDINKVKSLEVVVNKGQMIYIPAYWWYSIKLNKQTSICVFKYRTYMNNIAIFNHLFMSLLQKQNIKRDIYKKKNLKIDNNLQENNNLSEDKS